MLKIENLKISHLEKAICVDGVPTLSWSISSDKKDVMQTAYSFIVSDSKNCVYKSGKVKSDECIGIGVKIPLTPHMRYTVELTVWDNKGEEATASTCFEAGIVNPSNFAAKWIACEKDIPVAVFSKEFKSKEVVRAKLYASACGIFDVKINGKFISDDRFAPGWTTYDLRIQYAAYDVTEFIKDKNNIEITVAPGWYAGYLNGEGRNHFYGDRPAAFAELHLWHSDGTESVIISDESWLTGCGEVQSAEFYKGETVDKTFVDSNLIPAVLFDKTTNDKLVACEGKFVRITDRIAPISKIITPKGEVVLDFGQNIAGVVELKIKGKRGKKIVVRHAEILDREGNFYTTNLRTATSTDTFILSGGEDVFLPRFTFHGFRYIAVEGLGECFDISAFTACAMHTDMRKTCEFNCSNDEVNKLFSNLSWSMKDNFVDIPTDCPQRDERLGWTGDAAIFSSTAGQLEDTYLFFKKWLKDLALEQTLKFGLPDTIPNILMPRGTPAGGSAVWGDSATIVPWDMYTLFGDKEILRQQYESMKMWVEYIRQTETENHLHTSGHQRGDWLALDREEGQGNSGSTNPYLISTAFYAYSTYIVAQAAKALGYMEDEKEYTQLYEGIRKGFKEEFITVNGRVVSETQTGLALILALDLAGGHEKRITELLAENVTQHKNKPTTGFIGTPFLMRALSKSGRHDLAGKLLLNGEFPGWLNEVKLGATTMWERWDSMRPDGTFDESGMNSFNHYAFGAVGSWMIEYLVGIRVKEAGHKKTVLAPGFISGITQAEASRITPYGELYLSWSCIGGKITVKAKVPANTTATLHLPERETVELGSGEYVYEYATTTDLAPKKYTMDTLIRDLCKHPKFVEFMEQAFAGSSKMIYADFMQSKSLNELCAMAGNPAMTAMYSGLIDKLNKE